MAEPESVTLRQNAASWADSFAESVNQKNHSDPYGLHGPYHDVSRYSSSSEAIV